MLVNHLRRRTAAILAFSLMIAAAPANAQSGNPDAVALLFEAKHLAGVPKGELISYQFERKVSDASLLGAPFKDDVRIKINSVSDKGSELTMNIFSGERARDPQVIPDFTGNPLLLLFLDRSVVNYAALSNGSTPYLKGMFRTALREKAKVESVKIDYKGKAVDGYKVTVVPYEGDPKVRKMKGYEVSHFTFVVSPAVPGHFVEFVSTIESKTPNAPKIEERFTLASPEGVTLAKIGDAK